MVVSDPLRPNGTGANAWFSGDHTEVYEEVTQPDPGTVDQIRAQTAENDEIVELTFPNTIVDVGEVTNITVWTWGHVMDVNSPEVDINMGGWLNDWKECTMGIGEPFTWKDLTWTGSWSQSDLDGLVVRYRADTPAKVDANSLCTVYVIVTYTEAVTGYAHKVLGVAPSSIGKVLGVETANIGKVIGV